MCLPSASTVLASTVVGFGPERLSSAPPEGLSPEFQRILNETPTAPGVTDPIAQAWWDRGLEKEAARREHCGSRFYIHKCPVGHVFRVNSSDCGFRLCCEYCSQRARSLNLQKYVQLLGPILHGTLTTLTLSIPCVRSGKAIRQAANKIAKSFRAKRSKPSLAMLALGQHRNSVLTLHVIYQGPLDLPAYLEKHRPDIEVISREDAADSFPEALQEALALPIPTTPDGQVEMEILYKGTRLLRASGILIEGERDKKKVERNSSSDPTKMEKSLPDSLPDLPPSPPSPPTEALPHRLGACRCPQCGAWSVARTAEQGINRILDDLEYYPLPLAYPYPHPESLPEPVAA